VVSPCIPEDVGISLIVSGAGAGAFRGVPRKKIPNPRIARRNMKGISDSANDRAGGIWALQLCVLEDPASAVAFRDPAEHWPQWDEELSPSCSGKQAPDIVPCLSQSNFPDIFAHPSKSRNVLYGGPLIPEHRAASWQGPNRSPSRPCFGNHLTMRQNPVMIFSLK